MTEQERQNLIECGELNDEIEDTAEDIDEITQELREQKAISETRHNEILERVNLCLSQAEQLSTNQITSAQAENPMLTQVLNQLTAIQIEVSTLKSSMDSIAENAQRNSNPPEQAPEPESVSEDVPQVLEIPPVETETEKKKITRRVF